LLAGGDTSQGVLGRRYFCFSRNDTKEANSSIVNELAIPGGIMEFGISFLEATLLFLTVETLPAISLRTILSAVSWVINPIMFFLSLVETKTVEKPCEMEAFGLKIDSAI
jgi:hypothetical protein